MQKQKTSSISPSSYMAYPKSVAIHAKGYSEDLHPEKGGRQGDPASRRQVQPTP